MFHLYRSQTFSSQNLLSSLIFFFIIIILTIASFRFSYILIVHVIIIFFNIL